MRIPFSIDYPSSYQQTQLDDYQFNLKNGDKKITIDQRPQGGGTCVYTGNLDPKVPSYDARNLKYFEWILPNLGDIRVSYEELPQFTSFHPICSKNVYVTDQYGTGVLIYGKGLGTIKFQLPNNYTTQDLEEIKTILSSIKLKE